MDTATPAEACNIARALGIEAPAFDVNSACTSFFAQRPPPLADAPGRAAAVRAARRLGGRDARRSTTPTVRQPSSGATARPRPWCRRRSRAALASWPARWRRAPTAADRVVVPRTGHFRQDGRVVQMFAIKKTIAAPAATPARRIAEEGRRLHFVGHQANLRMLEAVCRECDVPDDRHHTNVALVRQHRRCRGPVGDVDALGRVGPTDDVAVVGVGAGLTWSSYLLRFEAAAVTLRRVPEARSVFVQAELLAFARGRADRRTPRPDSPRGLPLAAHAHGRPHRRDPARRDARTRRRRTRRAPRRLVLRVPLRGRPVQPGCLGVDARSGSSSGSICAWSRRLGAGRALGCGEIAFGGQILPHHRHGTLRWSTFGAARRLPSAARRSPSATRACWSTVPADLRAEGRTRRPLPRRRRRGLPSRSRGGPMSETRRARRSARGARDRRRDGDRRRVLPRARW